MSRCYSLHVAIDNDGALRYSILVKMVTYSRAATRTLSRIPADASARIIGKIEQYAADPPSLANNVKALTGRAGIRLRVGDWRVVMNDEGLVLQVIAVGARGSVYE